ncbi:MAG TPA: cisplatin damage response ATP-dependent DNA ligase [Acetobacteraceae bacterium]|jgi:DNA ligase-1
MIAFAELLERLVFTPGRNAKIALLRRYFATQPDPDRGLGLAAVTGELSFATAKPGLIRALGATHSDPVLFDLSYDYVGDLAETVALIWSPRPTHAAPPLLSEVVDTLNTAPKAELPGIVAGWLDASDASVRLALLKLITGGLRVGASARIAKIALAEISEGRIAPDDIEEVWHGLAPPYGPLFTWIEDRGPRPDPSNAPVFRPPMLAHPLETPDLAALDPAAMRAEWKWDGIRVQLVATSGGRRLYSRSADDISGAFPEIIDAMDFQAVLDGELLVMRDGQAAPFADLQQRLNRKTVGAKMMKDYPVGVRLYDMLFEGDEDIRALPFDARRKRLEAWFARMAPPRMDLSGLIPFDNIAALSAIRDSARAATIEGLMLKRGDSPYVPGRPRGLWWKWKRDPLTVDAVLMYAQRGHGKRSSYYSDYTFGLWREDGELVPVGKAYFGFTDEELAFLDRWVRNHTTARFGPVREVEKALVLEVAFDAAQLSTRHKSGVAMRFPRIARIRTDKPAAEADRLDTLMRLVEKDSTSKSFRSAQD